MKKTLRKAAALLSLLCLILSVCSCGAKKESCENLLEGLVSLYPDIPETESLYLAGKEETEKGYLSEQDAAFLYLGEYGSLPEWTLIDDFAVRIPDRPQVYELHVFHAANAADTEAVCKLLCRRADLLEAYFRNPEKTGTYDYSTYRAEVYVKGSYVFLLATPDNAAAIDLIEKSV
ncbi:MAG: hypothetical protein MJ070_01430 [Lachnospiraceae bacterium]|nr:hypothetical protein [Lachnospiraceae bacterium]